MVDTEKISIKTKVSIILIIQFLIFKHFLKTNTHARKYYWSVLCTEHKDGEKFILRAHLCEQVKSPSFKARPRVATPLYSRNHFWSKTSWKNFHILWIQVTEVLQKQLVHYCNLLRLNFGTPSQNLITQFLQ